MTVTSPCTGICKLDDATGWCLGCGRSGDEIGFWGSETEGWRAQVWDLIPQRLRHLGVAGHRLPWTTQEIRAFVATSLEQQTGTWVMGVVGAVAEFKAPPDTPVDVTVQGDHVIARTRNGALRMLINEEVRALAFDPPDQGAHPRILLAAKRERGRLPVSRGVADLGEDRESLLPDRGNALFDLGLCRKEARFCVRVAEGAAKEALQRASGLPIAEGLSQIGAALLAESPTRIVETALGRIEVQGQIPGPNARSPDGSHTHLLPDHLETGRALPVGMDLPRAYLPGAIFWRTALPS
ncbi:MAG: DUF1289 domain-containing protein [Pseudomonadota bacterium]